MTPREQAMARLTGPGQPFELHEELVRGVPMQVFRNRHRSLTELLHASEAFGDTDYLVTIEGRVTFAQHHEAVAALATALREEYDVHPGDRVALCGANSTEWIVAFWATVALGAVAVGVNSMWVTDEIAHGLELTEPSVIFADGPRAALIAETAVPVLSFETDLAALVERHRGTPMPVADVDEDDPAVILFTSGTSGRSKGATHSHRNVLCAVWFHLLNDAVATELGFPPSHRRYLLATPLFHIAGLHNLAIARLAVGDTAVLHLGRFDIDAVLRLIEKEGITNWGAVPTMLTRLLECDLSAYDLSSLRALSVNSAPSAPVLKERLRVALPVAGAALGTTYGLTESSTGATLATAADLEVDPQSVGTPVVTLQVEVRDAEGRAVPDGVEGEVCLRGPQMMLGYWRNPEATAESEAADGWFRTGDLGCLVDGHLRLSSRRSDLILRGAENVYPAEVENQLALLPDVLECIVLGVPDPDMGQAVAASVVVRPGSQVDEATLRAHLAPRLAKYKTPTVWHIGTEPLPRNATGKVNRRDIIW
ncbi:class I adenylate-forming enzyme family protein [Nocardioides sp. Root140]|uniref:class I adenylate-forming enzyme family protein n=1 Tax=Nocardioides sp. Root140 TaxID=1736460 RepID=UPI0006FC7D09|nr:AMP-binding protein [Nocardioides sp. Root140]KQY50935.1 fatty acid--CoA ligase [Nocardioides sp. Root140]